MASHSSTHFVRGAVSARLTLALTLGLTSAAAWLAPPASFAEKASVRTDAAIQSDVLKALATYPEISSEHITATTRDGIVTLAGTASNETAKNQAQVVAATVNGVRSVVNDVRAAAGSQETVSNAGETSPIGEIHQAQSSDPDGQQVPYTPQPTSNQPSQPDPGGSGNWGQAGPPPDAENGQIPQRPQQGASDSQYPMQDPGQDDAPPQAQQPPRAQQPADRPPYSGGGAPGQPASGYPSGYPSRPAQGGYPSDPYGRQRQPAYRPQLASMPLTVPEHTLISIRTSEPLDSRGLQEGSTFQATLAQDIYQGAYLAVPRGAVLHGRVVGVKRPGSFSGGAGFALQIVSLDLGGQQYPVATDTFASDTHGKGGYTTANTIGVGAIGAIVGAAAGGGPGAAIGAVAGGVAGLGVSAASGDPRAVMPPETLLTFHLRQPLTVNPVSYGEVERLQASATPRQPIPMRHRPVYPYGYPPPAPPPAYPYGPYGYPYPYRYWYGR